MQQSCFSPRRSCCSLVCLCGLAPALRGARVNLQEAIKEGARGSASGSSRRLNNVFVVSQLALSLVLLIGAALFLQSFRNLLSVNPGFRAENVLMAELALPEQKYKDKRRRQNFLRTAAAGREQCSGRSGGRVVSGRAVQRRWPGWTIHGRGRSTGTVKSRVVAKFYAGILRGDGNADPQRPRV